jgi:hypothetical protein
VQEELQPGLIQTFPAPPGIYTFTASSGSDHSVLNFGNYQLVFFAGQVYNDLNGDGSYGGGTDPGLQGWTVNLLDASGNPVATTTSASDGTRTYIFANLGPGVYTLEEINQDGWYQTQPVNSPGTYTVQAISSSNPSVLDFGNFQLVNVTGQVYDLNSDGSNDGNDPGLEGWTVLLLDPAGNTVATTTSDANGNYEFDNLFPGTFTIEEVLQSSWTQTQPTPIPPGTYTITTKSGMNQTGLNFGSETTGVVSGQVYNDLKGMAATTVEPIPASRAGRSVSRMWPARRWPPPSATATATTRSQSPSPGRIPSSRRSKPAGRSLSRPASPTPRQSPAAPT